VSLRPEAPGYPRVAVTELPPAIRVPAGPSIDTGLLPVTDESHGFDELTPEIATTSFVAAALRLATTDGPPCGGLLLAEGSRTMDVLRFVDRLPGSCVRLEYVPFGGPHSRRTRRHHADRPAGGTL